MCKLIRSLFSLIPIPGFRAYLIRKHISFCPKCQREWINSSSSTERLFTMPEWIKNERSLWPQIQGKIREAETGKILEIKRKKAPLFPRWQWALAGMALLILIGINLVLNKGLIRSLSKTEVSSATQIPQIKIVRAEIGGQKAKPFVYQTPENLFIWFERIQQEGE